MGYLTTLERMKEEVNRPRYAVGDRVLWRGKPAEVVCVVPVECNPNRELEKARFGKCGNGRSRHVVTAAKAVRGYESYVVSVDGDRRLRWPGWWELSKGV